MAPEEVEVIFVPVRFECTRGGETKYATQYIAVSAYSNMDAVRAAADEVLAEMISGERTQLSDSLPASTREPLVCGYTILPITAIPRPR